MYILLRLNFIKSSFKISATFASAHAQDMPDAGTNIMGTHLNIEHMM